MTDVTLEDLLIQDSATVRGGMRQLDKVASKLLFVVDSNRVFVGTLSDGDIRRWILKNGALDASLALVCNRAALTLEKGADNQTALNEMERLGIVLAPILLPDRSVWDVHVRRTPTGLTVRKINRAIDIPVVVMAGGKGTRMAPFTNVLPKPLIPVGERTILEIIIDGFRKFQVDDFFLTINYKGEMIRAYLDCIEKEYRVSYIKEPDFLGTAGSLTYLPKDMAETFIVSNCDIIVNADYADLIDFHRSTGAQLTVVSSIQHHKLSYGVIRYENGGRVTGLEEKPELSFCINTGVYVLSRECLDYIPRGKIFHMTDLMETLMSEGRKVVTYPVNQGEYIDIGQWDEYRKAVEEMSP